MAIHFPLDVILIMKVFSFLRLNLYFSVSSREEDVSFFYEAFGVFSIQIVFMLKSSTNAAI